MLKSTQMVLNSAAQQGGTMFTHHETPPGMRVLLTERCEEELRVSEREERSTDTTGVR